jgi:hypothetical protein
MVATHERLEEVSISSTRHLIERASLEHLSQRTIGLWKKPKLDVARAFGQRDCDDAEAMAISLVDRKQLQHSIVIVAHGIVALGLRSSAAFHSGP